LTWIKGRRAGAAGSAGGDGAKTPKNAPTTILIHVNALGVGFLHCLLEGLDASAGVAAGTASRGNLEASMLNDNQLQQAVIAELKWEPSVTAAHIGVTAKGSVVALTGHVESFVEKHAAETAAGRVKGVKAVAEEIEVRLPFDIKRGDEEIAAAPLSVSLGTWRFPVMPSR
jgi:BON domain